MFVLTDKGELYVFKIIEHAPDRYDMILQSGKPQFTGELLIKEPILVQNLPAIKQMAAGSDHFLAVDKKG